MLKKLLMKPILLCLIDMIHTALNVTGDVVSTLAVARIEHMYKE